jgi:hypothetical protein
MRYARINEAQGRVLPDGAKKIKVDGKWVVLSALKKVGTVDEYLPIGDIMKATNGDLYFIWYYPGDEDKHIEPVEKMNVWCKKQFAAGNNVFICEEIIARRELNKVGKE